MARFVVAGVAGGLATAGVIFIGTRLSEALALPARAAGVVFLIVLTFRAQDAFLEKRRFQWGGSLLLAVLGGCVGGGLLWLLGG